MVVEDAGARVVLNDDLAADGFTAVWIAKFFGIAASELAVGVYGFAQHAFYVSAFEAIGRDELFGAVGDFSGAVALLAQGGEHDLGGMGWGRCFGG